jgi:zinc protease
MKTRRRIVKTILQVLMPIMLVATIAHPASAQAGQQQGSKAIPLSQVERKNRAPVSKDVLKVTLPKPVETTLANGLTVLILEDHRLPTVNAQMQIAGSGATFEPTDKPGLAVITAQMLSQGTASRTSKQIAEDVDRVGANVSASSGFGSGVTGIFASGLSDNFDQWFAIAVDVLLNPSFPDDELAKLKQRLKANLKQQRAQPGFLANERFSRAVFGNFPSAVTSMTDSSLDAFTPADLKRWHDARYAPQNAILGIAGDVDAKTLIPKLQKWFGEWQKNDTSAKLLSKTTPTTAKQIYLVDRPNSVQTTITMGNIGIDRWDPDHPAMVVLDEILGAGPQSRLFMNLRENKGYTYGVYSSIQAVTYAGAWRAGGDVRTEVTDGAMTEFLVELNRIRNEKVPATELEDAKHAIVSAFALSLEQPATLVNYAIIRKLYNFPADYWDKYPEHIMAVTADDIQRVAKKYYNPEAMQIVVVGDASKIKTVMEKYGPVEMYATDGKPATKAAPAPPGSN